VPRSHGRELVVNGSSYFFQVRNKGPQTCIAYTRHFPYLWRVLFTRVTNRTIYLWRAWVIHVTNFISDAFSLQESLIYCY
jgi:hypothetical protein